ncbi:MAG: LacI family transcriptional regulator [Anaerolineaceae bacterium]|nr:LacI family transcriptional regulator [Anaerolineaceae bacterium]
MTATVKDVAKMAGVSTATVSHVVNKTRFVSEETTARVNKAIEELGYYPNMLVSSLRNKRSYTIGLVMPSISNETFGLLAETIQNMLFRSGYNIIICTTSYDLDIEEEAFNTLIRKKADAIIAIPSGHEGKKLKEIKGMGIPIVVVDRVIPDFPVDTVRVDNVTGAYEAIKYLIKLGHKSIGYIDRKVDQSHSLEQKLGYQKALDEFGIPIDPSNIIRADGYDYLAGTNAVKNLLQKKPQLTAIFAYYDIVAMGAMRGIQDMGYSVPNDFSIIGYDGMPFTKVSWPRLTTVSFPVYKIAKAACDLLIKRIESDTDLIEKVEDIVIEPILIVQESTSSPRTNLKTIREGAK